MCEISAGGLDGVAVCRCVPARELAPCVLLRSAHVIGGLVPCRNFIASLTFSGPFLSENPELAGVEMCRY